MGWGEPEELGSDPVPPTGTGLVYDHRGPEALEAAWGQLEALGLVQRCCQVQCRPATEEELKLVQSPRTPPWPQAESPGGGLGPPDPLALGSLLELLGKLLRAELRNGLALVGILLVDWGLHPDPATAELFQGDPSVLYFGVHQRQGPARAPPSSGAGLRVELLWEEARGGSRGVPALRCPQPGRSAGDYAAAFCHLLLPIAFQFQPQLVLVAAGFDAAQGHPEGLSPGGFALLTHFLSALAGGCLLLALQGGWSEGALPGGLEAVLRTLLGDPGEPPGPMTPTPSGLASIAQALGTYRRHWSCLQSEEQEAEEEEEQEAERREDEGSLEAAPGLGEEEEEEEEEEEQEEELQAWPQPAARTGLLYDLRMEEHQNPWDSQHPESPQRLRRVLERLQELGLAQRCLRLPARAARAEQLRACHTPAHVAALSACGRLRPRELRALAAAYSSLYLCPGSFRAASLALGTACAAARAVLAGQVRNALAVLRPPGHHAGPGSAGGFCLFNNVAAAARHAQRLRGAGLRVLILDWDVHHGNGTQEIFEGDPSVLYISLHRHDGVFFPGGPGGSPRSVGRGLGAGFTFNVGWGAPRVGDAEYLAAVTRLVLPVACQFAPQLVLVSAGFDAGRGDPLGGCLVSPQTFGVITHLLGALAGGRLVLVLEGGYNLGVLAEGVGECLGVLLGDPPKLPPLAAAPPQPAALKDLERTRRVQSPHWECLRLPPAAPPAEPPPAADVTKSSDEVAAPPALDAAIAALGQLQLEEEKPLSGGGASALEGAEPLPDSTPEGGGALFAVAPLLDCPHLGTVTSPPADGRGLELAPPCGTCGSRRENWLCLSCYQVLCGRYVGGHMVQHWGSSGHPLVLSLQDLSAWCYPCEAYVHHPTLLPAKLLLHRLKFGADPPAPATF
ncbi:histone deacetylase 6 [Dryobates pubescens]|uniref:histone deacetylase 6 n=1 Tax=Dryobates pubescens TaxID=118200 RepID=UPI0023B9C2E7|nr:histone deacetylase 6 [Dryobates pubescens]